MTAVLNSTVLDNNETQPDVKIYINYKERYSIIDERGSNIYVRFFYYRCASKLMILLHFCFYTRVCITKEPLYIDHLISLSLHGCGIMHIYAIKDSSWGKVC
jgi:hypothetical protein